MMVAASLIELTKNPINISIFERNNELGKKVVISGGGRCNVTTGILDIPTVLTKYPRGQNFLKPAIFNFPPIKVQQWFTNHGVPLKTESDLRVFPQSDDGHDIVKVFNKLFKQNNISVNLNTTVQEVKRLNDKFIINTFCKANNTKTQLEFDYLIITTGGQAYRHTGSHGDGYNFAEALGHTVTSLAPSLNAFKAEHVSNWDLAGLSFQDIDLTLTSQSKKFKFRGDFVFTHQGLSGPAIFALAAQAAYEPLSQETPASLSLDLTPDLNQEELRTLLVSRLKNSDKLTKNLLFKIVPQKIANLICQLLKIENLTGDKIVEKQLNQLVDKIKHFQLTVLGRAAGEEFVTAGGVPTKEVSAKTMESRKCPNLYFAGEILDVDGLTGGFNLQASWATGRLAAESIIAKNRQSTIS